MRGRFGRALRLHRLAEKLPGNSPLGFTLEEMRDLLEILDALEADDPGTEQATLRERLTMFHEAAQARVQALRDQLATAEGFAAQIEEQLTLHQ